MHTKNVTIVKFFVIVTFFVVSDPTSNMKVPARIVGNIINTHKPPYNDKVSTTGDQSDKT